MVRSRALVALIAVLLFGGCSLAATAPGRLPSAPAADDMATRQVVARGDDTITLLPASPAGLVLGAPYAFTMPACGTAGPVDVDGSFWDAADDGELLGGQSGVFLLVAPIAAIFTTPDGRSVALTRHVGAKTFRICS